MRQAARGATWTPGERDRLRTGRHGPLYRIPASGGALAPATTARSGAPRRSATASRLSCPMAIISLRRAAGQGRQVRHLRRLAVRRRPAHTRRIAWKAPPAYAEPGWLLYVRQGVLAAQPFDPRTRTLRGNPVPLGDEPTSILDPLTSFTAPARSRFRPTDRSPTTRRRRSTRRPRGTTPTGETWARWTLPPGHYETATVSPDGSRAIFGPLHVAFGVDALARALDGWRRHAVDVRSTDETIRPCGLPTASGWSSPAIAMVRRACT